MRILFRGFLSTLAILFSTAIYGQQAALPAPRLINKLWEAAWIAPPKQNLTLYGVFHFRKTFTLASVPKSFVINVSADNRYRLFINGQPVCSGPARGDLKHWQFETIDIAGQLTVGKNVMALQVWNFAETRAWGQLTHQTGMVVQGNTETENIINTNESWKVIENTAYAPIATIAHITGPGDQIFAQRYPWGWQEINYDDGSWANAIKAEEAMPASLNTGTRRMVQRTIPFMEEKLQRIPSIKRWEGLTKVDEGFIKGNGTLEIAPWKNVVMLFDQQVLTTAFPELIVSGGKGAKILLRYAEALVDTNTGEKGNQNPAEYLKKYPGRFELCHIKTADVFGNTEVVVDYPALFLLAEDASCKHFIIENEMNIDNPMEYAKKSANYLKINLT